MAVGHTWSLPQDIEVPLPSGAIKKIKAVQQFVLEDVKTGVATIRVSTDILTPITDPAVESQLVQREAAGRVRFDIDAGRILGQQMDIDKHVVGFRGDASSIHYVNRFSSVCCRSRAEGNARPLRHLDRLASDGVEIGRVGSCLDSGCGEPTSSSRIAAGRFQQRHSGSPGNSSTRRRISSCMAL